MLQCVYYASIYSEILKTYRTGMIKTPLFTKQQQSSDTQLPAAMNNIDSHRSKVTINIGATADLEYKHPFKVGIIGCGQVGTMILTKLIEI